MFHVTVTHPKCHLIGSSVLIGYTHCCGSMLSYAEPS